MLENEEIKNMITAFGTGIGEKEYNINGPIPGPEGIQGMNEEDGGETKVNNTWGSQGLFLFGGHKEGERLRKKVLANGKN